jgi:hypothetical protein
MANAPGTASSKLTSEERAIVSKFLIDAGEEYAAQWKKNVAEGRCTEETAVQANDFFEEFVQIWFC